MNYDDFLEKESVILEKLIKKAEFSEKQITRADRSLSGIASSKRVISFCQRRGIYNPFG